MRKSVVLSVVVAIVLTIVVVWSALSVLRDDTSQDVASQDAAVQGDVTGEASASKSSKDSEAETEPRPDCPAGTVAGVELPCLGGEAGGAAVDEGVAIVNIWAWWCEPCREELPYLEDVAQQHPEWTVVGVHADRNAGNGAAFLNDIDVALPSYQDDENLFAGTLGLPGVIPITLLVVDGEVKEKFIQPFTSAQEIESAVNSALAA